MRDIDERHWRATPVPRSSSSGVDQTREPGPRVVRLFLDSRMQVEPRSMIPCGRVKIKPQKTKPPQFFSVCGTVVLWGLFCHLWDADGGAHDGPLGRESPSLQASYPSTPVLLVRSRPPLGRSHGFEVLQFGRPVWPVVIGWLVDVSHGLPHCLIAGCCNFLVVHGQTLPTPRSVPAPALSDLTFQPRWLLLGPCRFALPVSVLHDIPNESSKRTDDRSEPQPAGTEISGPLLAARTGPETTRARAWPSRPVVGVVDVH